MFNFNKRFIVSVLVVVVAFSLAACGKKDAVETVSQIEVVDNSPEPSATPTETATPEPTEDLTNKEVDYLTGMYISKEAAARRPFAVVINNFKKAKPQSGISQADIIYEVLAEGDITRLVAIFRDFNSTKIGPVRSARDYFLDFAYDTDAIFVHHGGSPQGYALIKKLGTNNLDGMREATMFWRDKVRASQAGMYEHSSYTDAENILKAAEEHGYRTENFEDGESLFDFYATALSHAPVKAIETPTQSPQTGVASIDIKIGATDITVPFSAAYTRKFVFNAETKTYKVFQGEEEHIDEETNKQLEVTNIIVQNVHTNLIAGDTSMRINVDLIGKGKGVLITNGEVTNLTWEKKSYKDPTKWLDEDGEKLTLNIGKTWVCVYNGDAIIE